MSRNMINANGKIICKACAMKSYVEISREYRPLVSQWIVYKNIRSGFKCAQCGN